MGAPGANGERPETVTSPEPFVSDPDFTLYVGDVRDVVRGLPAESVDCVVTSPPYWGLRDYGTGEWDGGDPDCDHAAHVGGSQTDRPTFRATAVEERRARQYGRRCAKCGATRVDAQIGLEPSPAEYVAELVAVFREVRRVLTKTGTVWLNLGDSYVRKESGGYGNGASTLRGGRTYAGADGRMQEIRAAGSRDTRADGLKDKDLVGIPWRVAFALQEDGWFLRSDIIWAKPNPMPESVTDRPTKAHEYVFLLAKQPRYFFDQEAVREPFEARPQQRLTALKDQPLAAARRAAGVEQGNPQGGAHVSRFAVQRETLGVDCGCADAGCGRTFHADDCGCACHAGAPAGNVARFIPPDGHSIPADHRGRSIPGTPAETVDPNALTLGDLPPEAPRGPDGRRKTVHDHRTDFSDANHAQMGDGRERWPNADGRNVRSVWTITTQPYADAHFATFPEELARRCIVAGCPEGGVVFDPFIGSGTVALVARKTGRRAVGVELNPEYARLCVRRTQQLSIFAGDS